MYFICYGFNLSLIHIFSFVSQHIIIQQEFIFHVENVTFIREMSFADYLIIKRATEKSTQSLKFF